MARSELLRIDPVCELIRTIERHAENARRCSYTMTLSWAASYLESLERSRDYHRQSITFLLRRYNKNKTTTTETEVKP